MANRGAMRIWDRCWARLVHAVFVVVAGIVLMPHVYAQRDGVIYEKVAEQERHIDASDKRRDEDRQETEKANDKLQGQIDEIRKMADDNRETLDEYKFTFGAVSCFLTGVSLLGLRLRFSRGKESNG